MPNRPQIAASVTRRVRRWLPSAASLAAGAAAGGDPTPLLDLDAHARQNDQGGRRDAA